MIFIIIWIGVGIINAISLFFIIFRDEDIKVFTLLDILIFIYVVAFGIVGAIIHLIFYLPSLNKVIIYKKKKRSLYED